MEIIIFIVVGLFVLGAILAILKFIWGLFKKSGLLLSVLPFFLESLG